MFSNLFNLGKNVVAGAGSVVKAVDVGARAVNDAIPEEYAAHRVGMRTAMDNMAETMISKASGLLSDEKASTSVKENSLGLQGL